MPPVTCSSLAIIDPKLPNGHASLTRFSAVSGIVAHLAIGSHIVVCLYANPIAAQPDAARFSFVFSSN